MDSSIRFCEMHACLPVQYYDFMNDAIERKWYTPGLAQSSMMANGNGISWYILEASFTMLGVMHLHWLCVQALRMMSQVYCDNKIAFVTH